MRRHTAMITAGAVLAVVVLTIVALLAGGEEPERQAQPPPDPEPAPRLVAGLGGHPGTLDPHTDVAPHGRLVLEQVYDTLVRPGPDLRVEPALAESWEVADDELTWTFRLRDDVRFHDGTALVADDVVASLERVIDHGEEAVRLDVVEELRAPDLRTVEVELRHPAADLPARLASSPRLGVVPAAALADEERTAPLPGTGPFRPTGDVDEGGTVVLEPVLAHWERTPELDRLAFVVVGEHPSGLEALRDGEIHWLASLEPRDVEEVEQDRDLELSRSEGTDHWHLALDTRQEPFDDPEVRRALGVALDRAAVVEAVRPDAASVNQTAVPAESWWHHDYAPFEHDPDAARTMLDDAGATPLSFELLATDELAESVAIAEEVATQLVEIEVDVTVRTVPLDELLQDVAAGDFDAYALGWTGGIDPDEVYWPTHHSEGERNYHGLVDEETDELLEAARREPDDEARAPLYAQATERLVDQAGQLYLFNPHRLTAWSAELRGVTLRPDGLTRFDTVAFEEPPADEAGAGDAATGRAPGRGGIS